MNNLKEYLIQFVGLKIGKHQFDYQIDNSFFLHFDYNEFNSSNLQVEVLLEKKQTILELHFKHKGTINVPCDLTNEDFDLPIKGKMRVIVKFGEEYNDENEELLILPNGEYQLSVAQYIYEMIVLSIPLKRIHPGIKDGTLKSDAIEKLEALAPKKENKIIEDKTDPRWDNLKKLLTDK